MPEFGNDLNIICLESKAFYALIEEVVERISPNNDKTSDKWITRDEAMQHLRITSKTTIQNLRDSGKIRFSQPMKKVILYDRESLDEYLERHAKETF